MCRIGGKAPYKSGQWIAGLIDKSGRLRADTGSMFMRQRWTPLDSRPLGLRTIDFNIPYTTITIHSFIHPYPISRSIKKIFFLASNTIKKTLQINNNTKISNESRARYGVHKPHSYPVITSDVPKHTHGITTHFKYNLENLCWQPKNCNSLVHTLIFLSSSSLRSQELFPEGSK